MHICCLSCVVVFNPAELPEDLEPVLPGPVPARHGPAQPAPPPPLPATEPAPPAPALPAPGPALPPHASLLRVLTVAVDTPPQHGDVHAIGSPASCGNGSPASCGNGSPSIYMATPPTGQAAHHFHRGAAAATPPQSGPEASPQILLMQQMQQQMTMMQQQLQLFQMPAPLMAAFPSPRPHRSVAFRNISFTPSPSVSPASTTSTLAVPLSSDSDTENDITLL